MKGGNFPFESTDEIYYICPRIILNCGAQHIYSADWIKNKKARINRKNNNGKSLQYPVTVSLNHKTLKIIQREYQKLLLYKRL